MSKTNATMSKRKINSISWKKSLRDHAENLETQADLVRIASLAETPHDGVAVIVDLAVAAVHHEAARRARAKGHEAPPAPPPISKFLTQFAAAVRETFEAVSAALPEGARARLSTVMPGLLARLDANDHEVISDLFELMKHPADIISLYIFTHLDQIEARFAS